MKYPNRLRQPEAGTSAASLSFFIHHGAEIVPDEPGTPSVDLGIPSDQSDTGIPLQIFTPVIPSRRSSLSILRYVTANYTDGTSQADYSSTRSSPAPAQRLPQCNARRRIPSERHISALGRNRVQDNAAFYPVDSIVTVTRTSGVYSDESSSTSAEEFQAPNVSPLTVHETAQFSDENQRVTDPEAPQSSANVSRHVPQPSIPVEVVAQIFEPHLAHVDDYEIERQISPISSVPSSAHPDTHRRAVDKPADAGLAPEPSSGVQPVSGISQQRQPVPSNLNSSQTQSSRLSRWSAEYDKFSDDQHDLSQQPDCGGSNEPNHKAQQPNSSAETQPDLAGPTDGVLAEDDEHMEVPETAEYEHIAEYTEPVEHRTGQTPLPASFRAFKVTSEAAKGDLVDSTQHDQATTIPNPARPNSAQRQLLPPGIAAQNARYAMEYVWQAQEQVNQLIFEEQARTEALRLAINENIHLRQELVAARQGVAERDGEIARLRGLMGHGEVLWPLFSYSVSLATPQGAPPRTTIKPIRENPASQEPTAEISVGELASELQNQDITPPQFISGAPVYDHALPDQRVIPRRRRRRQSSSRTTVCQDADVGETSHVYAGAWEHRISNENHEAVEPASETETVMHYESHVTPRPCIPGEVCDGSQTSDMVDEPVRRQINYFGDSTGDTNEEDAVDPPLESLTECGLNSWSTGSFRRSYGIT